MKRSLGLGFLTSTLCLLAAAAPTSGQQSLYDPEARLMELGIELPEPPSPVANYVNGVQTGNLIFLAGKGPRRPDGSEVRGKLGADLTIEEGYEAARLTAINQLAVLKAMLGDLSRDRKFKGPTTSRDSPGSFGDEQLQGASSLFSRPSSLFRQLRLFTQFS